MIVQHNITAMNANRMLGMKQILFLSLQRNFLPVTESTVQQMMQLV